MTKTNIQVFQLWHCGCDCITGKYSSIKKVRFKIGETDFNFKSLRSPVWPKSLRFCVAQLTIQTPVKWEQCSPTPVGTEILKDEHHLAWWYETDGRKWFPFKSPVCLWRFQFIWKPKSRVLNMLGLFPHLSFPYLLLIILQFPVYHSIVCWNNQGSCRNTCHD